MRVIHFISSMLCSVALISGAFSADVLVVRERVGVDRWRVMGGQWGRVGAFGDMEGLKPVAVLVADGLVYMACENSEKSHE